MGSWISATMRSWSLPVGRIGDAHVRLHLSYFFLLFCAWGLQTESLGSRVVGRGIVLVGLVLASVIAHELAHALVTGSSGGRKRVLILLPLGGVTLSDESIVQQSDPVGRVRVAVLGPLVNLIVALAALTIIKTAAPQIRIFAEPFITAANLPRSFVIINLFLAAIHLVPAYPMDGGRVLRAELAKRMNPVLATRKAVSIGQLFATALLLCGFWNSWLMIAGFLLFLSAMLEERSIVFQSVLDSLRLEEVMLTDFSTLSPADTLEDALAKAVHTLQDDFPVIRGNDMVGVITRQRIADALRVEGNGYVQMAMEKVFQIAQRSETLASALRKLAAHNLSIIPVVDEGRLVGIVTFQNLMRSMRLLAESRRLKRITESESL
jgi:Zn-dependent protease/CBS domain-containing protein